MKTTFVYITALLASGVFGAHSSSNSEAMDHKIQRARDLVAKECPNLDKTCFTELNKLMEGTREAPKDSKKTDAEAKADSLCRPVIVRCIQKVQSGHGDV